MFPLLNILHPTGTWSNDRMEADWDDNDSFTQWLVTSDPQQRSGDDEACGWKRSAAS